MTRNTGSPFVAPGSVLIDRGHRLPSGGEPVVDGAPQVSLHRYCHAAAHGGCNCTGDCQRPFSREEKIDALRRALVALEVGND